MSWSGGFADFGQTNPRGNTGGRTNAKQTNAGYPDAGDFSAPDGALSIGQLVAGIPSEVRGYILCQ